jgi:precorrin-2 dehydrogenase/sirohydrochlorin ferrochelatase
MSYLVNLDVRDRLVLVVGAGAVAARKIAALVLAKARVTVIAPTVSEAVHALERDGQIRVERRPYASGDTRGAFVVISATDDDEVNRQVADEARACDALVNVVDRPALCTFTVPAVVRRGDLTLAVATEGRCPSLARAVREQLERQYGPEYAEVVTRVADLRERLIAAGWEPSRIHAAVSSLVEAGLAEAIACGDEARAARLLAAPLSGAGESHVVGTSRDTAAARDRRDGATETDALAHGDLGGPGTAAQGAHPGTTESDAEGVARGALDEGEHGDHLAGHRSRGHHG